MPLRVIASGERYKLVFAKMDEFGSKLRLLESIGSANGFQQKIFTGTEWARCIDSLQDKRSTGSAANCISRGGKSVCDSDVCHMKLLGVF